MKRYIICLVVAFWAINLLFFPSSLSAAPLKKVSASFDAFAYANPPFWIAKGLGLFEQYGLDV
ncbi:MAG: hypothetical protein L7F78_20165, partial [Syntrophales bacterium LBB04]|nr:hypothetical protein [Syntrophales bacterium LBB04]